MKRRDFLRRAAAVAGGVPALPALVSTRRWSKGPGGLEESAVFVSGEGYPIYRIPSLIASRRGTLLAFAEGRRSRSDHSENDLVLRRSADGGRTWGPMRVVAEDGAAALVNPTALEDRDTGRLWLAYQRYPADAGEREVVAGWEGDRVCRSFLRWSDDDGATWSEPRETTRSVKRPQGVTSLASGPGIGIQLRRGPHRGRLVVPFNQGPWGDWKVYAAHSDDHGESWRHGETAPEGSPGRANEVQMVELADGTVMLNARNQGGGHCRKVATSRDGGETWSPLVEAPELVEPQCQGTILRCADPREGGAGVLLFANPASPTERMNGVVRLSRDEGRSWPVARTVYPGPFAYSCLAALADGGVGLLYERDGYRSITLARFDLAWLTGGRAQP